MIKILPIIFVCLMLSSCETVKEIQESDLANKAGSFELNPVQANSYWYNGKSYEYNEYQIEITTKPVSAKIQWNGKTIGTTPMIYRYSGTLDMDDRVVVRAIPVDENLRAEEAVLRIRTELPRKINIELSNNTKTETKDGKTF